MWAIGIILYQLLSKGNLPFKASNPYDMPYLIRYKDANPLPVSVSPFMKELVT